MTNGESFVNTKRWIEEVKNNCGDDGVPIVLVGNKCDSPSRVVSFDDQQDYAKFMNLKFFETSAKENINVDDVSTLYYYTVHEQRFKVKLLWHSHFVRLSLDKRIWFCQETDKFMRRLASYYETDNVSSSDIRPTKETSAIENIKYILFRIEYIKLKMCL